MEPVKVLHIITKLELGGAQQNTIYTVSHLDRGRFMAALFAGPGGMLDEEARSNDDLEFRTVPHLKRKINPIVDFKGYRELRRMIRDLAPAIVHTHSSKAGVLGRLAAAAERTPVVIHSIHGFGIDAVKNPLIQRALIAAERKAARKTTHFIAVSRQNIDDGIRMSLFDADRVSLIYSGIDLRRFREAEYRPGLLKELGIESDTPIVGNIACFKPQKNPMAFVEMASRVHAQEPSVKFLMIGDGELRAEVQERISELGISGAVLLLSWRRDIPELLKLLRVSVLTSRWEGLPRVIPESLSAQVPVVVTRAGGSAEAVIEGETGFVLEQGDIDGMVEKVLLLVRNSGLAQQMGAAGPESVMDWDIDRMVRAQEKLYLRLLNEHFGDALEQ